MNKKQSTTNGSKINCMSFPRSGHHMLINLLADYYHVETGESIRRVNGITSVDEFKYCETYHHCDQHDCPEEGIRIQKNHDFRLDFPKEISRRYIVQLRHPLESIVSYYNREPNEKIENSYNWWLKYCRNRLTWWTKFMEKWCYEVDGYDILYIKYEDFLEHPHRNLSRALSMLDGTYPVNEKAIDEVITSMNVSKKNNILDFKYYNNDQFSEWQENVMHILNDVQITTYQFE